MHKLSKCRNLDVPIGYRIPGRDSNDRNREIVKLNLDRSCFRKNDNEKWLLKKAKTKFKWDQALKELKQ